MKYLLDTHILIWALADDEKLPKKVLEKLNDFENQIFYSVASIWEIEIKRQLRPERMPVSGESVIEACNEAGFIELSIMKQHALTVKSLLRKEGASEHHDPFDRILIAQAKNENMKFLTHDKLLVGYDEDCIMYI